LEYVLAGASRASATAGSITPAVILILKQVQDDFQDLAGDAYVVLIELIVFKETLKQP